MLSVSQAKQKSILNNSSHSVIHATKGLGINYVSVLTVPYVCPSIMLSRHAAVTTQRVGDLVIVEDKLENEVTVADTKQKVYDDDKARMSEIKKEESKSLVDTYMKQSKLRTVLYIIFAILTSLLVVEEHSPMILCSITNIRSL